MRPLLSDKYHRQIYIFTLAAAFVSLPLSVYTLSIFVIALSTNWLLDGRWPEKIEVFRDNYPLFLFLAIYFALLIGIIYSSNLPEGLKELRLKLPLLFVPLVVATSKPLLKNEKHLILLSFSSAVIVASVFSTSAFIKNFEYGSGNVRMISPFISHIRFALMLNLAIVSLIWFFISNYTISIIKKVGVCLAILWLTFFLFILQSLTGILMFLAIILFFSLRLLFNLRNTKLRVFAFTIILVLIALPTGYVAIKANNYFLNRQQVDVNNLPAKTPNGNLYIHHIDFPLYENGNLVWINLCFDELKREWAKRSIIHIDSTDRFEQPIYTTLVRYMASKGLPKDSLGIWQLDDTDIKLIESGATSVIFREARLGVFPRLYQVFWEIDQYLTFEQVSGSSFVQRFVFLKAALKIISNNFWVGVGTGDLADSFNKYYASEEPHLKPQFWYLSHNQFLTQFVQLGIWGFIVFIAGWFAPIFINRRYSDWLAFAVIIIITLSMLNEDTLQTHTGVSLASLFYSIMVLNKKE